VGIALEGAFVSKAHSCLAASIWRRLLMQAVVGEWREPAKFGMKSEATAKTEKTTMISVAKEILGMLPGFGF
jgi:hypothetical protein